jgi:hypothetical protein
MHQLSPSPVKINPGFSHWLAAYLLLAHFLATVLVILLETGVLLTSVLTSLVIASLIYYWRRDLLQLRPESVIGLDWSNKGGWTLRLKSGSSLKAELCPSSLVSRRLVILHFKTCASGRQRVAIPGDAIDSNLLRQLQVLLKMHCHFGV